MKIRSLLNGGVAEVNDEAAKALIAAGHWVAEGEAVAPKPTVRKRAPRAKASPATAGE